MVVLLQKHFISAAMATGVLQRAQREEPVQATNCRAIQLAQKQGKANATCSAVALSSRASTYGASLGSLAFGDAQFVYAGVVARKTERGR